MSDSKTETLDPKTPVFTPEQPKKRGRKPEPAPNCVEFKIRNNPHKEVPVIDFKCYRCQMEVRVAGLIYTKPYCSHCHIEMARDKK